MGQQKKACDRCLEGGVVRCRLVWLVSAFYREDKRTLRCTIRDSLITVLWCTRGVNIGVRDHFGDFCREIE